jgi:hypothetical protein
MAPERMDDDELGRLLAQALQGGLDDRVDTARLTAGAQRGARRIRRRRRAGVAVLAVLAVAAVPAGEQLLGARDGGRLVSQAPATSPDQGAGDAAGSRAVDTPGPLSAPATSLPPIEHAAGDLVVPDAAMLDLAAVNARLEPLGSSLGTWTADSSPLGGTGWPRRLPCQQPEQGDLDAVQGLRELGSDDGSGATLYTKVAVYRASAIDDQWTTIRQQVREGSCNGGLTPRRIPASGDGDQRLLSEGELDPSYDGVERVGRIVVEVSLWAPGDRAAGRAAVAALLDDAVERAQSSGFAAAVEAGPGD